MEGGQLGGSGGGSKGGGSDGEEEGGGGEGEGNRGGGGRCGGADGSDIGRGRHTSSGRYHPTFHPAEGKHNLRTILQWKPACVVRTCNGLKNYPPLREVATADILLPQTPAGIVKRPRGRGEVT